MGGRRMLAAECLACQVVLLVMAAVLQRSR
jgi:hypothetical protein